MEWINIQATIHAPLTKVWACWTKPEHVVHWNFASDDWHCPEAKNDLRLNGEFHYLMAAKDGSMSFDFWGTYLQVVTEKYLKIVLGDGRKVVVEFEMFENSVVVKESFEPENENPVEMQKQGWQMILDNFKKYTEDLS